MTWSYRDWKDNLVVDRDAPVLAWRQEKGRRLGWENSHEALAWNVFRGLEVLGAGVALASLFGLPTGPPLPKTGGLPQPKFWARERDGTAWGPFKDARETLEEHVRGPDVNFAAPDVALVEGQDVVFVVAGLASPLTAPPPRWFSSPATPALRRRRRAILEGMLCEEEHPAEPFRRGVEETIRRGFYSLARRFLLARATARRLGSRVSGRLAVVVSPATMRHALEDAERFRALLGPTSAHAFRVLTWRDLAEGIPPAGAGLLEYLASRSVNRAPAHLVG